MHWRLHNLETAMRTKPCSRSDPSGRSRGCDQLELHTPAYRDYLLDRGNGLASYVALNLNNRRYIADRPCPGLQGQDHCRPYP